MTQPDPVRLAIKMLYNAIDHEEWMVLEALLHPQTEFQVNNFVPFRGRDAVMNFYRNLRGMKKGEHLIEALAVDGSNGVCWGRFTGTKNDGLEISVLFAEVLTFEDKKIKRRREYHCVPKLGA